MRRHLPLLGILLLALVLRLFHIGWGLPEVYEEATPYRKAWAFWNWGGPGLDFHPRFFNYPALTFYIQFGVQAAHYAAGRAAGTFSGPEAFRAAGEQDPTTGLILARLANAFMDLGTVLCTCLLAKRLAGERGALLAGLLVAVAPIHIQQAQMVNVDVPLTLFATAALYAMVRLQEEGTWPRYVLAGLTIGLAASAKYTGALLLLPLLAAVSAREGRNVLRRSVLGRLTVAALLAAAVFAALNPFVFIDARTFIADFGFEQHHMESGHFGIAAGSSTIGFYLVQVMPAVIGLLPLGFALLGAATTRRQTAVSRAVLIAWPLLYLTVILSWTMRADRYFLPMVPVVAVWCAFGVLWLWERVMVRITRRAVVGASSAMLGVILLGEPLMADVGYYRAATLPDTRDLARTWIEKTLPPGAVAAMAPLGLILKPPLVTFPIPYRSVKFEDFAPFYDARWYEDFDLAVGSNFDLARYRQEPGRFGDFLRFYYDSLETRWSLVQRLDPVRGQRGPAIWLYAPARPAPSVYDPALLDRLRTVSSNGMLHAFMSNLLAIQTAKGNAPKVTQLLEWQVTQYPGRGLRREAVAAVERLLHQRPGDQGLVALRDSLARP